MKSQASNEPTPQRDFAQFLKFGMTLYGLYGIELGTGNVPKT